MKPGKMEKGSKKVVYAKLMEKFKNVNLQECDVPVAFCIIGVLPAIIGGIFK